jgi:hypothetical protein
MDEITRGIATAALTLQSAMLQALVAHGVVSPAQALDIVDLALEVSQGRSQSMAEKGFERVASGRYRQAPIRPRWAPR